VLEKDDAGCLAPGLPAAVDAVDGLSSAVQFNVVEFHTWNSTTRRIDEPDRVVFDLHPGESDYSTAR